MKTKISPAVVGLFVLGAMLLVLFALLTTRQAWPSPHDLLAAPPWIWFGGLLGAFYITATIVVVPRLGTGLTFALIVAGQMLVSLLIDQVGLFGSAHVPLSASRVAGAMLLVFGVVCLRR